MFYPTRHDVILHDAATRRWLRFSQPHRVLRARHPREVIPLLTEMAQAVEQQGLYAAGFLAYEAAPAFDAALQVRPAHDFPLIWFGLYDPPEEIALPHGTTLPPTPELTWQPSLTPVAYKRAIAAIKSYIAGGFTYQVNYSFRLRAPFSAAPWPFFLHLLRAQEADYGAYVDTGRFAICSASPELFFHLDGQQLRSRPMKGTTPRGLSWEEDERRAAWLAQSEKNRAENVMIVDMIRNDMGRVATVGSVSVPALFTVERYPTVWQMTSTVTARTGAGYVDILRALFPCASITGAPKPRTMSIIAELEQSPRHVYTGAIGYFAPQRRAQFNVAIRTVLVDRERAQAEYGVGGGIVWDSEAEDEFAECNTKARVLTTTRPPFQLLETLRWTREEGYFLLDYHLRRLRRSAAYFGFAHDGDAVRDALAEGTGTWESPAYRVRLLLARDGTITIENQPFDPAPTRYPRRVCLAPWPIKRDDPFLYHKTTNRGLYEKALAACPGYDDVLLWNEDGELTESCIANLVVERDGVRVTPPLRSGLLPGTYRAWLLDQGLVQERVVTLADLPHCKNIWLVNALRKEQDVRLTFDPDALAIVDPSLA
jgi:para-aminobenzoate synthetase/4-amino-4-deoxychorismate lyase